MEAYYKFINTIIISLVINYFLCSQLTDFSLSSPVVNVFYVLPCFLYNRLSASSIGYIHPSFFSLYMSVRLYFLFMYVLFFAFSSGVVSSQWCFSIIHGYLQLIIKYLHFVFCASIEDEIIGA